MPGMIEQAQGAAEDKMPVEGAPVEAGGDFNAEDVKSKIEVPPELKEPFQRILAAGMKVMYDEQTHELAMKQLDGPGAMGKKLGEGVAGLLMMLFQESNSTLPPQLIIPAGVFFIADVADFLQEAGKPIESQDVGQAVETMLHLIFQQAGMDAEKMFSMLDQLGLSKDESVEPADPAEPAGQTPEPPAAEEGETASEEVAEPVDKQIEGQMKQRKNKRLRAKKKGR